MSGTGVILQLLAQNNKNHLCPVKYSMTSQKIECQSNKECEIPRTCDIQYLDALLIDANKIELIKKLIIIITDQEVWEISFTLLMKLSKVVKNNDKLIIEFSKNFFLDNTIGMNRITMRNSKIHVRLETKEMFKYDLMIRNKYLQIEERQLLAQEKFSEQIINQYAHLELLSNREQNINSNNIASGIFIETKSPILLCTLTINNDLHSQHDSDTIKLY